MVGTDRPEIERCHNVWAFKDIQRVRFVAISGPSASGKSTVQSLFRSHLSESHVIVKYTDRRPRLNEVPSVDYHYVRSQWFGRMAKANRLLSYELYYGSQYGVTHASIQEASEKTCIVVFSPFAAVALRQIYSRSSLVFVATSARDVLRKRLYERGLDEKESRRRTAMTDSELQSMKDFDYIVDACSDVREQVRRIALELC